MPHHPQREAVLSRIRSHLHEVVQEADAFRAFAETFLVQGRTLVLKDREPADVVAELRAIWDEVEASPAGALHVAADADDDGVRVTSVIRDQPFVVDTIRLALKSAGAARVGGMHQVLRVVRGEQSRVVEDGKGELLSVSTFVGEGLESSRADEAAASVRARLGVSRAVADDFSAMKVQITEAADRAAAVHTEDATEASDLLRWMLADNFVFIGVSARRADAVVALGADRIAPAGLWPAPAFAGSAMLSIRKAPYDAPIHRAGRVDVINLVLPDLQIEIRGMFTHRALTLPCRTLPVLRRSLRQVLAITQVRPDSYLSRGFANVFDALPTEWLFSASIAEITDVIDRVFATEQDQSARVSLSGGAGVTFALIAVPERRYSDAIRTRLLQFLKELTGANYLDSGLFAGRFDTVLLQVFLTGTRPLTDADREAAQAFVTQLATSWKDRVAPVLYERLDDDTAATLLRRYADAFPPSYTESVSGDLSAHDLEYLEKTRLDERTRAMVYVDGGRALVQVYQRQKLLLTDLMPVLDNFGLVISSQAEVVLQVAGVDLSIASFEIAEGTDLAALAASADRLVAGLEAVFEKKIASDNFNRLVLAAGQTWQDADLLRAYFGYARQIGLRHTWLRCQEILLKQASVTAAMTALFHARFDPDLVGDRNEQASRAASVLADRLREVKTNEEDLLLRTLANLVEATLRTNFYRTDRAFHYISFKLEHARIKSMPLPRMMVEIYVHHREVEGLHLRGGPVARGGLRFSDRSDFRTEILGLVTTQMVKNVVIVPEGSKGGFYIKYTIDNPAERKRKGDELYQVLIRGMLDLTDNIVGGSVVRPPRVVAHDGDDPYLVVAADKGTAHLSDTANRLSLAYGFWLGDAFASGGSNGYDHKVVGITARGGWVLVRRHFREMGIDPDRDLFTCAGVGDCGGDVFGNGVIETPKMRLLAAFNHVHIFLDPDPDAARSFIERRRLFDEVKGWDHYDRSLISAGGGVYDRRAKSIPLSPEARLMLGTNAEELTPDQVISLILKLPVDLFWSGGIGTYVRASHEVNGDANDPPNDDVRVTALDMRCKVVGEGGNLGFTQAARVEYALAGGRLNTDFVDNSGGVDTSDHEVNLKILLNPMVASGRITLEERNDFLRTLTEDVVQAVLADNNANGRLISLDVVRSAFDPMVFSHTIDWLCQRGGVSPRALVLPGDDTLRKRAANRQGVTRPEISVIQAHVKMHVFKLLKAESTRVIPGFDTMLMNYFPPAVRARFGADIPEHMLAKDIGLTVLLTEISTDAGAAFFPLMMDLTGASAARIAGAWCTAMAAVGGEELRRDLVACNARPEGAHRAWVQLTAGLSRLVASWLSPGHPGRADEAQFRAALAAVAASRSLADAEAFRGHLETVTAKGIPAPLAAKVVGAADAAMADDIALIAGTLGKPIVDVAVHYQAVGHATRLLPALRLMSQRRANGRWDPVAFGILGLRYQSLLREIVATTPPVREAALGVDRAAEVLGAGRLRQVGRIFEQIVGEQPDVGSVLVAEQQIRAVLA